MAILDLIIWILLIAASFSLPAIAIKLAPRRIGPVPDTGHLTPKQQRDIRRRLLVQPRFWIVSVAAVVFATTVTSVVYLMPSKPGPLLLATMLGVPYVVAVSAVMYLLYPVWHGVVTNELKRLGELRNCPRCSYDLAGLTGSTCPECGLALSS